MSTNQQRLKSAIQRIARSDPQIRSLLKAVEARGDIPANGASASNDAEQDRQCCDGSVAGGGGSDATVGTETRFPEEGGQTGLNSDNAADLDSMDGGSLDGLTDCETGQPVKFDGSDWIPPEGWDSPTEPPINPDYQEGYYFSAGGNAATLPCGAWRKLYPVEGSGRVVTLNSCSGGATNLYGGKYFTKVNYSSTVTYDNGVTSDISGTDAVSRLECSGGSPSSFCDPSDDDIRESHWPSDGTVSLAVKNGAIVGSKYDPENNGDYSKPKSEVSLCDGEGNEVNIKPSASGGWKSMDYSRPGDGYLYDGTGKQIARISGSEYSDPNI